jgi:hypothetical protein
VDRVVITIWCLISFIVSGFFIYHGIFLFSHEALSTAQTFYATTGLVYGVYSAFLLVFALKNAKKYHEKFARNGVIVMFLMQTAFVFMNDRTDINTIDILIGLLFVLFMLIANWLSVKYVVKRKQYA